MKLKPFVVGLYSGNKKPGSVHEYIQCLIDELQDFMQTGIRVPESEHNLYVQVSCIICDTPARDYIKQNKGHSGYFGCDKCSQSGIWLGHAKSEFC